MLGGLLYYIEPQEMVQKQAAKVSWESQTTKIIVIIYLAVWLLLMAVMQVE